MRPFSVGDGAAVHAYWKSDLGWEQYNESVPSGFTEKDASDFVEEMCARDRVLQPNWALIYDDTVVGVVSLSFEEGHRTALLGYGIHGELRGRGLVMEAVTKILNCAFAKHLQLAAIQARTDTANTASIRVLKKLGFVDDNAQAGTFQLLRAEWEAENDHSDL